MSIIQIFQDNILDNSNNNIQFYFTKTNNLYVIHIYNPYLNKINITNNNKPFYEKVINMLFNKNKSGCFNHEYPDENNEMNKFDFYQLLDHFLVNKYIIILVNNKCDPLSYLTLDDIDITIWTVCTNRLYRKRGYMTVLLNHCLKLIKYDKLKINLDINKLKMYIRKINPLKNKLIKYYRSFKFLPDPNLETSEYLILKYII